MKKIYILSKQERKDVWWGEVLGAAVGLLMVIRFLI